MESLFVAMSENELRALRHQIDVLDEDIVALLARRFVVTRQVGILKAFNGLPEADPSREHTQMLRYDVLAMQYGLNPNCIRKVFRCLIDEVVANHTAIATDLKKN